MKKRMFAILLTAAMVMTSLSGCKSADSGVQGEVVQHLPQQGEEGGHPLQLLPGAPLCQRGGCGSRAGNQRAGGQRKGHGKHLPVEFMRTGLFLMHGAPAQKKKSEMSGGIFIWQKLW